MADPITEFFDKLTERDFDARLEGVQGTISFDVGGDGAQSRWFVKIARGKVNVSSEPREVDCVIHSSRAQLASIVTGQDNMVAAMLRGAATADGQLRLAFAFQRVMPGPPGGRDPRDRGPVRERGDHA